MFYAIQNKMPANVTLFRELILLRDEAARLLGYPHHAALRISDKMMRDHDAVLSMLQDPEARLVPEGARDIAELKKLKPAAAERAGDLDVEAYSDRVFFWDIAYLADIQEKEGKSVSIEVSDYYELHHTLDTLLGIFRRVFDVHFQRVPLNEQMLLEESSRCGSLVWHYDVLMYAVWDKRDEAIGDAFMGYTYFDLHPRQGKYTHQGHYQLDPVSSAHHLKQLAHSTTDALTVQELRQQ